MILFTFNIFPISVNKLYCTKFGQRRRFLTTEGKKFKEVINSEVSERLKDQSLYNEVSSLIQKPLEVELQVYSSSWLLKDQRTVRVKDIGNIEKALLDSVFTSFKEMHIDLDDSQIWQLRLTKHFSTDPDKTIVVIKPFEGIV